MISIVIPVRNEEDVIADTLRRLREGTHGISREIILSDDGSTDRTVDIATPLVDRVVRYEGQQPKTIGANRNRGAAAAKGDIILFLDSDVRIREPGHFFEKVTGHFAADPKLVAMTVSMRVYPEAETRADKMVLSFFDAYFRLANNVLGVGLTHGKCMVIRASAFRHVGGFNARITASEDAELFMRLSKIGTTMLDPALRIYFSGRRAHALGWPRLLWRWTLNGIWITLFKRGYSGDWQRVDKGMAARDKHDAYG